MEKKITCQTNFIFDNDRIIINDKILVKGFVPPGMCCKACDKNCCKISDSDEAYKVYTLVSQNKFFLAMLSASRKSQLQE